MSRLPSERAISGVVTIAQAAPSLTPQQSYRPSGVGDHRRRERLLDRDAVAQVRLGAVDCIRVAFPRNVRHRALEVRHRVTVACGIGCAELRERPGRSEPGLPEVFEGALGPFGQAGEARVLELFDAERERNVDRAGRDGIGGAAQCLGAGGTEVLDARDRHVGQSQRHRQRQPGTADALLLVEDAEPGGLDAVAFDARVLQRFGKGLDHQVVRARIPAFTEP
jgi:hypothetical protein